MIDEDKTLVPPLATDGTGVVETWGSYAFDVVDGEVHIDGAFTPLTAKEFTLALMFFRNLSRPLSRDFLFAEVWGGEIDPTSRTVDAHICEVRKRLRLRPENGFRLSAVYGFGYRLERLSAWEGTVPRGVGPF